MATDIILINGVSLPYHVLDRGIEIAKGSKKTIKAIFLYENEDSGIDVDVADDVPVSKADFSRSNAEKHLVEVVTHNADFSRMYFARHNVDLDTLIIHNPSIEQVVEAVEEADTIYIEPSTFKLPDEFAYVNFSFEELQEQLGARIEWCEAEVK